MTIQPILPLPVPNGGATDAPTSGVDAEFAALIEQNLGAMSSPAPVPGSGVEPTGASLGGVPAGDSGDDEAADAAELESADGAELEPADVAVVLMNAFASAAVATSASAASPIAGSGVEDHASLPPVSPPTGASPSEVLDAPPTTAAAAALPEALTAGTGQDISGLTPVAHPTTTATTTATSDESVSPNGLPAGQNPAAPAAAAEQGAVDAAQPASTSDLGLTITAPATGSPVAGPATPSDAPGVAEPSPVRVVEQVFGEVSRLVSRGDGSHRITIKLQPEALGDVRVTLSVKNGEVHVSLAADRQAHHALLEGAPELHRLLESVGAKTTDIVVKDLPSFSQNRSDLLGQPGAQYGTGGQEQSPDQTAGKQSGDTSARDGGTTEAAADRQPSPIDPGTRTRSAGVDVTM